MTDSWYYAHDDQPAGPVSLRDLKRILARFPDGMELLVWRDGFVDWRRAGEVEELVGPGAAPAPPPARPPERERAAAETTTQPSTRTQAPATTETPAKKAAPAKKRWVGKVLGGFALIVAVLIGGYFGKELARAAQDW